MSRRFFLSALLPLGLGACGERPGGDAVMGSYLLGEPGISTQPLVVCPDGETTQGIDVSRYQNEIDWAQVAWSGIDLAYIRVSDGLEYPDARFATNWAGAAENGILRGAYQFFRASQDPIEQADYLLEHMGELLPGDLPPVIDIETLDGESAETLLANASIWIDHVEEAVGATPIIYTAAGFWNNNLASTAFADHPLWAANWDVDCPNLPAAWNDWVLWQNSARGVVAGIAGDVDVDLFNGTLADLEALAVRDPGCGDGRCLFGETNATCPLDCPGCSPIPRRGRVVDETDPCFTAGGTSRFIRLATDAGYNGKLQWSRTWITQTPDNYGEWQLSFDEAGSYRVEAYTAAPYAEWNAARYTVRHAGATEIITVDQTAIDGFVILGDLEFESGGDQWILLEDAVSSAEDAGLAILFDAIRLTRLGLPPPDGGELDGGDPDGGSDGGDPGGEPDMDAGGEPDGGDPGTPDAGDPAGDSDGAPASEADHIDNGDVSAPPTDASAPTGDSLCGNGDPMVVSGCRCDAPAGNGTALLGLLSCAWLSLRRRRSARL